MGIGEGGGNGVSYGVAFPDDDILTSFCEWELEATGAKFSEGDFQTGESIKVRVRAWSLRRPLAARGRASAASHGHTRRAPVPGRG
jgi:hypothetical protein